MSAKLAKKTDINAANIASLDWTGQESAIREAVAAVAYNPSASVVVDPSGTDTQRGTALAAAYTAAKALTPNGAALSATNRASVIIPPGVYELTTRLVLDQNFVDLVALIPEQPNIPLHTDLDQDPGLGGASLTQYRPSGTQVVNKTNELSTIQQAVSDVRMIGFTVAQLSDPADWPGLPDFVIAALHISADDNDESFYDRMYFWARSASFPTLYGPVVCKLHMSGVWKQCVANAYAWRIGYNDFISSTGQFRAKMYDCVAGAYSFIGDSISGSSMQIATGAEFYRCRSIGQVDTTPTLEESGFASFAGCGQWSVNIDSSCIFVDCESGPNSFGSGGINEGTFIRCRAGVRSFGALIDNDYDAEFRGYAEDCVGGAGSFGGRGDFVLGSGQANGGNGFLSGTLVRCTVENSTYPTICEGATIRDCRMTTTGAVSVLHIRDDNTKITGSTILPPYDAFWIPIERYSKSIDSFSNAGGGKITATCPLHGFKNGQSVTIVGTANYNGTYTIESVTKNTFNFADTWVATETGTALLAAANIVVAGCVFNNFTESSTGLGGGLTNLVLAPGNIVDDAIQ